MALSPPKERKHSKLIPFISIFFSLWILLLLLSFPSPSSPPPPPTTSQCPQDMPKFYIYDLPSNFNDHLLHHCESLNIYTNMCPYLSNEGLGRQLAGKSTSWFVTHQFLAEMVFHKRALRHPCRTLDPTSATLFHVPFYAGLYASSHFRTANLTLRDELAVDFSDYLTRQSHWHRHLGLDHFIVIGRTAWDFMRNDDSADFGANRLLLLPEIKNMTVLTVERQPWAGRNQYGIPYPSYFHPRNRSELTSWQELVRKSTRTHLFSFVGGSRPAENQMAAVRAEILKQCNASVQCLQVECEAGSSRCYEPDRVLNVMMRAEFCLQPPGDSFTRRSVFDSILAGCVPVFFSQHTAYTQYKWYMPNRTQDWSVFLGPDQWSRIEQELGKIPKIQIQQMRIQIVELIPSMTYAHPDVVQGDEVGFRDAVDVALVELKRLVWSSSKPV